jgi:predicted DNA-binding transcriptional regulator AlpA
MFNLSQNPRVIISMESLAEAFYRYLQIKPYNEISIQEICEKAGVTRKTFYRNFETKDDLFDYYIYEIIGIDFPQENNNSLEQSVKNLFNYFSKEKTLLSICEKNNLFDLLLERINKYLELNPQYGMAISDAKNIVDYGVYYWQVFNSSLIKMLEVWTRRGFKESVDDLYQIFEDITKRFGTLDYHETYVSYVNRMNEEKK